MATVNPDVQLGTILIYLTSCLFLTLFTLSSLLLSLWIMQMSLSWLVQVIAVVKSSSQLLYFIFLSHEGAGVVDQWPRSSVTASWLPDWLTGACSAASTTFCSKHSQWNVWVVRTKLSGEFVAAQECLLLTFCASVRHPSSSLLFVRLVRHRTVRRQLLDCCLLVGWLSVDTTFW